MHLCAVNMRISPVLCAIAIATPIFCSDQLTNAAIPFGIFRKLKNEIEPNSVCAELWNQGWISVHNLLAGEPSAEGTSEHSLRNHHEGSRRTIHVLAPCRLAFWTDAMVCMGAGHVLVHFVATGVCTRLLKLCPETYQDLIS